MRAILVHNVDMLKLLIGHGANVHYVVPESGENSLICAVENGFADGVQLLIDNGANPSVSDGRGEPIHHACESGNAEIVQVLLDNSVDPDAFNSGIVCFCCSIQLLLLFRGNDPTDLGRPAWRDRSRSPACRARSRCEPR